MTDLEKFYNEYFKKDGDPDFDKLDDSNKKQLAGSIAFAGWKIGKSKEQLALAIKNSIGKLKFPFK